MYEIDENKKTALNNGMCTVIGIGDASEENNGSVDVHNTETLASHRVNEVVSHSMQCMEDDGCSTNQCVGNNFGVKPAMTATPEVLVPTLPIQGRLSSNTELESSEVKKDFKTENERKENVNAYQTMMANFNENRNAESVSNPLIIDKSIIQAVGFSKKSSANDIDTTTESSLSKILNQDDSTINMAYEKQSLDGNVASSHRAYDTPISYDTILQARELIADEEIGSDFDDKSLKQTRVVLIGITGSGKSATGNTLLGRKAFKTSAISTSVTARCEHGTRTFEDRYLAVVDTPGLYDTEMSEEEVKRELARCIMLLSPGPHAFLIIIKVGRFNEQEKNTVELLVKLFGDDNFLNYSIVIITRKDELEEDGLTLDEYVQRAPSALKQILNQCGNRCFAVNNKLNEEEKYKQTKELLSCIDEMGEKSGGSCYSHALFEKVEKERKIRIEKEKQRLEEEAQMMEKERQRKEEEVQRKEIEVAERERQLELETLRTKMEWIEKQDELRRQKQEYENERLRKELELEKERTRIKEERREMEKQLEREREKRERVKFQYRQAERDRETEKVMQNLMEKNKNTGYRCSIM